MTLAAEGAIRVTLFKSQQQRKTLRTFSLCWKGGHHQHFHRQLRTGCHKFQTCIFFQFHFLLEPRAVQTLFLHSNPAQCVVVGAAAGSAAQHRPRLYSIDAKFLVLLKYRGGKTHVVFGSPPTCSHHCTISLFTSQHLVFKSSPKCCFPQINCTTEKYSTQRDPSTHVGA